MSERKGPPLTTDQPGAYIIERTIEGFTLYPPKARLAEDIRRSRNITLQGSSGRPQPPINAETPFRLQTLYEFTILDLLIRNPSSRISLTDVQEILETRDITIVRDTLIEAYRGIMSEFGQ